MICWRNWKGYFDKRHRLFQCVLKLLVLFVTPGCLLERTNGRTIVAKYLLLSLPLLSCQSPFHCAYYGAPTPTPTPTQSTSLTPHRMLETHFSILPYLAYLPSSIIVFGLLAKPVRSNLALEMGLCFGVFDKCALSLLAIWCTSKLKTIVYSWMWIVIWLLLLMIWLGTIAKPAIHGPWLSSWYPHSPRWSVVRTLSCWSLQCCHAESISAKNSKNPANLDEGGTNSTTISVYHGLFALTIVKKITININGSYFHCGRLC